MQGKRKKTKRSRAGGGSRAKKRKLPAVAENAKENDSNSSTDEENCSYCSKKLSAVNKQSIRLSSAPTSETANKIINKF